jgi:hypothetical protein
MSVAGASRAGFVRLQAAPSRNGRRAGRGRSTQSRAATRGCAPIFFPGAHPCASPPVQIGRSLPALIRARPSVSIGSQARADSALRPRLARAIGSAAPSAARVPGSARSNRLPASIHLPASSVSGGGSAMASTGGGWCSSRTTALRFV